MFTFECPPQAHLPALHLLVQPAAPPAQLPATRPMVRGQQGVWEPPLQEQAPWEEAAPAEEASQVIGSST